jgi:hypothetical protein
MLAMALAVAHCGGNDVHVSTDPGVVPSPGTFNGTLSDGGSIRIEAGSIEEIAFTCDGQQIQETFTPPRNIDSDGTFSVKFNDGGREFRVSGTFRDNHNVDGTIEDEDNQCDVSYDATRGNVVATVTPARTPTATPLPGITATVTPGDGVTATVTPGGVTPTGATKTATPTPTGSPCPIGVEIMGNSTGKVLDAGFSGLGHNQAVIQQGKLSFSIAGCDSPVRPCGECNVAGPIANPKAGKGDINSQRCTNKTETTCTKDADCPGGKCAFYFGAPLPLTAGGTSTCIINRVNGSVSGTANIETGAFASSLRLIASVFVGASANPCPRCIGDVALNDGLAQGTCDEGLRKGEVCDANGTAVLTSFGITSLDCLPKGLSAADLDIDFSGSSGTETKTLSASSGNCSAVAGKKCFCPEAGKITQPNACLDDTATPAVDESLCQPLSGSNREGECPGGPVDTNCAIATFNGCLTDADCMDEPGDSCGSFHRPCYLDNGVVGGSVIAQGMADPPTNGVSDPTFAALFCVGSTGASAVNQAAGLPGLGRVELPLHSTEIKAP